MKKKKKRVRTGKDTVSFSRLFAGGLSAICRISMKMVVIYHAQGNVRNSSPPDQGLKIPKKKICHSL